jgi:N-acetylmuramoyl-L-alanine amidase
MHSLEVVQEEVPVVPTIENVITPSEVYENVVFKVQLAAGSTAIETKPYNFKGLKGVSRDKEGKLYKYYFGSSSDYLAIQNKQRDAKKAGYSNCYIVAFKDGKKISVNDALKSKTK